MHEAPDRLAEQARKFGVKKTYQDYRDMLADKDIDAVSIVTCGTSIRIQPSMRLMPESMYFSKSPWPRRLPTATRSSRPRRRRRVILQIGHNLRFNPRYRMAKQAIDEGRIGKIVALQSRRNKPAAWTPTILEKIGPIVGDAIHDTDLMLWFTGDRVVSAYAQTVSVRNLKYPDIGQTMYRFKGGATATLETVWCMPEKTPFASTSACRSSARKASSTFRTPSRNLGIVDKNPTAQPGHDLLADVRRHARRRAPGRVRLFRQLRAQGQDAGNRAARGCCGGA